MKNIKITFGILAILPVGLAIASIADPKLLAHYPALEWLFILVGVPIFVLNLWVWTAPHIIKNIFGKGNE